MAYPASIGGVAVQNWDPRQDPNFQGALRKRQADYDIEAGFDTQTANREEARRRENETYEDQRRRGLISESDARNTERFNTFMGQYGSTMGRSGGGATAGTWTPSPITLPAIDTTAASNAAFGRAKDQVGQETTGALGGLRSAMAGRGMLGSGGEFRGAAAVVNRGQGELGDASRAQAMKESDLAAENARASYSGGIEQRGQDIQMHEADATRAQAAQQDRMRSILGLWSALQSGSAY